MTVFRYGNYDHTDNEVNLVSMTKHCNYSPRLKCVSKTVRMVAVGHICEGTYATLLTKIQDIYDAYKFNNAASAGLVDTPHFITDSQTLDGIRVVDVDFPTGAPGELANGRTYRIVLEALFPAIEDEIVFYSQSLMHIGTGGSRFVMIPNRYGVPVAAYIAENTPMTIIQSGNALGLDGWVPPAAPHWGTLELLDERKIVYTSPRRLYRHGFMEYGTSWSYTFVMPSGILPIYPSWY